MKNTIQRNVLILSLLTISACSSSPSTVSGKLTTQEQLVSILEQSLGAGDRAVNKLVPVTNLSINEQESLVTIKDYYFTPYPPARIEEKIEGYCDSLSGKMVNGGCEQGEHGEHLAFFYKLYGTNNPRDSGYDVSFYAVIPKENGQDSALKLASDNGYVSTKATEQRIKEQTQREVDEKLARQKFEKEKRLKEELMLKQQQEHLAALKEASVNSRKQVMQKGTKVCLVSAENFVVSYTEESANGKIKLLVNNQYIWDWPDHWYACDR